jgi:hypothetical protein
MTYEQIRERADRVRHIPLSLLLPRLGAHPDRHDRSKWLTTQGPLSVTGTKFMNWQKGIGGGGAIDLVLHLKGGGFKAAVAWLCDNFPSVASSAAAEPHSQSALRLPPALPNNLTRVRRYLSIERGLAPGELDSLIDAGSLYADNRANAVFLLRDDTGSPVGAELRGTSSTRWHSLAPGSRKDLGYFSAGPATARTIVLCESAIDALSLLMMHPDAYCISTAGATPNPPWLRRLFARSNQIYCAFDSDEAGDRHAKTMLALHPAIKRLRPTQHDWNDQLRSQCLSSADHL